MAALLLLVVRTLVVPLVMRIPDLHPSGCGSGDGLSGMHGLTSPSDSSALSVVGQSVHPHLMIQ